MRSRVRPLLIIAVTVGLLAFFLHDADLAGVWNETRRADPLLLILAICVTASTYVLRTWRWQMLLAPIGRTRFSTAFRATVIGFAASFVLPARAGEVIRPYLLARREGLRPTSAFATIILERFLDLATVLLLFGVYVLMRPAGGATGDPEAVASVNLGGAIAAVVAVGGLGLLFALAGHPERLGRAAGRVERVLPARIARIVAHLVEAFAQGLAVMRSPGKLALALILSFPLWLSLSAGVWLTSQAFHITFPFTASFLIMTFLVVGVAAPTPGAVGGFHWAYKFGVVTFFGVPEDRAVGAAIVLHAISFVPVTIAGIFFMAGEGLTFGSVQRMARTPPSGELRGESGAVSQ